MAKNLKTLKQWATEEAIREGIGTSAVMRRFYKGRYPKLKLRRISTRVIYVDEG